MGIKKYLHKIKGWQIGAIVGLIFVIFIYIPLFFVVDVVCQPIPCTNIFCLDQTIYSQECLFWREVFLSLVIIPLIISLPLSWMFNQPNEILFVLILPSIIYIILFSISGCIITSIKKFIFQKRK